MPRIKQTQTTEQKQIVEMLYAKHGKLYLTKDEVTQELQVSQATIDRMRKRGEIKSSKIGNQVRFSLNEIAKFVA